MPAFFALLVILLFAVNLHAQPRSGGGPPAALVVTAPVEESRPRVPLTFVGLSEARFSSAVASEVEGLVEALPARRGRHVERGAVLAQLRTHRLALQIEEARAALGEVEARITKAQTDVRRARELFEQAIVSEEEFQTRQTELDALEQSARNRRAALRSLDDRLARMTIRAPFAGRIAAEMTEVGQWLREGDQVVWLDDLSVVHVMIPVPEQQLARIAPGNQARIRFDALPGRDFSGRVTAVIPRADAAARTFPVQIEVDNRQGEILGGMLARVSLDQDLQEATLLVPKDAFVPQPDGQGFVVRVIEGKAEIVPVNILAAVEDFFAVAPREGELAAGDRVVIRGNERLRDGQAVREASAEAGS
ncbi:efflux RND transporter periplasmic adaptor subunit [Geoalkalibacter halelectricus]|uniref:efflux RND transporter periplasmic adaptor subunit n=1 Tax=Geoalkalibacter halelectricus TaxID=2847045 RepID=UPI00266F4D71|nr:efflux RND transporter periplasmic adaptor subunit [Geoalkalibacter halelectricus]MDO3378788.1 efflux RND transporter periplasmic adaptor subunit [Geoalkalibacter halelectricus]